jgi:hypothetical protein
VPLLESLTIFGPALEFRLIISTINIHKYGSTGQQVSGHSGPFLSMQAKRHSPCTADEGGVSIKCGVDGVISLYRIFGHTSVAHVP